MKKSSKIFVGVLASVCLLCAVSYFSYISGVQSQSSAVNRLHLLEDYVAYNKLDVSGDYKNKSPLADELKDVKNTNNILKRTIKNNGLQNYFRGVSLPLYYELLRGL